ncbi:MAG TPA: hypothetical protein VGF76_19800 [Polyangiaceae bacterium]
MTKLSFWSLALLTGVGCAVVACGSDDDSGTAAGGTGGKSSAGAGGKGSAGKPGVGEGGAAGAGEEAGAGGLSGTLYERLGGHAGIQAAIGAIVTAELADSDIASYFAPNLNDPQHMPQPPDIEECFTDLLGQAAGGPETYPTTLDDGYVCRSMAAAHAALHIGGTTFDNFVMIAGGVLKDAHVADADINTIALVLTGMKPIIIDKSAPLSGPCIVAACEVAEAGAGGSK